MDLTESADQQAYRAELRAWLTAHATWDVAAGPPRHDDLDAEFAFLREWQRTLASGRYVGVAWPSEYGGRGLSPVEHFITQEELARVGAPELVGRIGVNLVGPTLLAAANSAQKQRWLPRILGADDIWCQLFSEPGAGSDLASLTTRAERVDDGWRVTGQKVWTSYAQYADWGVCLARTDADAPKHKGISYLVVDMRSPGIEVRPLRQLTGEAEFNEVFLDDVHVPDDQVVGAPGEGWRIANSTLTHERGTNPRQLVIHMQLLDDLVRLALGDDALPPRLRQRVSQAYVECKLFQLHNLRSLSKAAEGKDPGPVGAQLKLYWSEMSKRMHDTAMAVLGDASPLWRGAEGNPGDGSWQRSWLYYRAASIWAGTNEIQRTVVGERVLGLPKEPSR
jgi:alkylation response protein AidB-like acyl-CoA dehydrogenase